MYKSKRMTTKKALDNVSRSQNKTREKCETGICREKSVCVCVGGVTEMGKKSEKEEVRGMPVYYTHI